MSFLKGLQEKTNKSSKNAAKPIKDGKEKKVVKKKKIGFNFSKKKEKRRKQKIVDEKVDKILEEEKKKEKEVTPVEETAKPEENIDLTEEIELVDDKEETSETEEPKLPAKVTPWTTSKKRKKFLPKDMKGKPVFLEDTGEKLGEVFEMMYDNDKKLIGYKIKDKRTDSVLSFPLDQFEESNEVSREKLPGCKN